MVDVKIPTTDGREIVMQRYGEPKDDVGSGFACHRNPR